MPGGAGSDTFAFYDASDSKIGRPDTITDFRRVGGDQIDLRHIEADRAKPGKQAFIFIDQDAFTGPGGASGEVRQHVNGDGMVRVEGDVNHDGIADFAILIHTAAPLVTSDIVL